MKQYSKQYIDACRARMETDLAGYRLQLGTAASKEFETRFFNNQLLLLDYSFVNRLPSVNDPERSASNEVRVLCDSLMVGDGRLQLDAAPRESTVGLGPGDAVALTEAQFLELANAFFSELENEAGLNDPASDAATSSGRSQVVRRKEQRFASSLFEALPGIFYLYDAQGRFRSWNTNFERVTGYSAEEIARLHPLQLFKGEERALLEERIGVVFEQGEATVEASLLSKQGTLTPYFFTGKRIEIDGLPHLVGLGVDIAERKRAELALLKSEERYRTTMDSMLESCQLLDFDWRYLYLNPAAARQNRRPNEELLGRTMPECWPGIEYSNVFLMLQKCMSERVHVHAETEFQFADGSKGWFDVRAQPAPEGIFVLSVDISERIHALQALRELNENLEVKVAERTRDLDAAKERAEAADRVKSAFLATMSHELRTPLNSIIGFTGIILKNMAGPLTLEQSKQLKMVQGSARHLLDLINDVLDISKIEAGQLQVRCAPFDLKASITRVKGTIQPLADKKELALEVLEPDEWPLMSSDQRRVEQILLNLLNNAVKFTDRGTIVLSVKALEDFHSGTSEPAVPGVMLRVVDTGIGMHPDDLASLFQPFRQIDSGLQRQHEGTGLGLAICRRLVTLLGGTIAVESAPGQGSTFTVCLPATAQGDS